VANTMPRSLRIPETLWQAAVVKAKSEGITVTAVVVAALRLFVKPQRLRRELDAAFEALETGDVAVATFHIGEVERLITTLPRKGRRAAGR
jgi:type IV secretory pathway ATPase VirB11/archaellum biosynthesis ATPase